MPIVAAIIGILCLGIVIHDVFEAMLLPRRVRRRLRLVRIFFNATWAVWSSLSMRAAKGNGRETSLAFYGPFSMVLLILTWVVTLIAGYGLLHWALAPDTSVGRQMYLSGATFFTLGYGDVIPLTPLSKALAIVEAGTGFGFIAIVIGYLPVLYQLFSRREAQVIQLDARAGSPPSAVTLLTQHAEGQGIEDLYRFLGGWEAWSAELVESHLSYPMLSYYRSQHDNQSWLAAICSILDSCALILVGLRGIRTFPAKMAFATSRLALIELSRALDATPRPETSARQPAFDFQTVAAELAKGGLNFTDNDPETKLAAFRSTYEPFLVGLSNHLLLPLPNWLPGDKLDNWQNSPRGRRAKQLVDNSPARPK